MPKSSRSSAFNWPARYLENIVVLYCAVSCSNFFLQRKEKEKILEKKRAFLSGKACADRKSGDDVFVRTCFMSACGQRS